MSHSLQKVENLFHRALSIPPAGRRAFLEGACGGDLGLLREVEELLCHFDQDTSSLEAVATCVISDLLQNSVDTRLAAGAMLGPYRLDRRLGEGGMGLVYLATDTRLARRVAIKVVSRVHATTTEMRTRFLREARAAASLSHPNIATIYDFGQTEQFPWLVMEYVEGRPFLSDQSEPLDEDTWTRYAIQIADALAHAHSRGLIHRDIKPPNILITTDDRVKIIDFGLARAIQEHSAGSAPITAPGSFVGTIAYSAPELLRGGSASARSDVYSLGVVFYEMACGEQPFHRFAGHELISAVLMGNHRACRDCNPRVSPHMTEIIETCMAREPAARYADAASVLEALRRPAEANAYSVLNSTRPAIAVLDFRHIGNTSDLDWLGTGIAETLSTDLAKLKSVRVVGRSRIAHTLRRLGTADDPHSVAVELGRELQARWIVTGSYQQIRQHIRLTISLTEVATGDVLVTGKIDGLGTHLFELQDRVVVAILDALTIQVDLSEQQKILHPETRHLVAYEQYANGRRRISQMQGGSLSTAIHHFKQAVILDPDYALAYSGLGTAHALQFIATNNSEDIKLASNYLERAIELDPELGEPYPWLANIRVRKNDPDGAFLAGQKGVELQPDLAEAHYFYAGLHYMLPDFHPGAIRDMPSHFAEAIRLQPRFHAAWVVFGATAAFLGRHSEAISILAEAVRLENEPDLLFQFVGARTLLAIAQTRLGLWEEARIQHLSSIEVLRSTEHVYADTFEALSACGLGDIDMRTGNVRSALLRYRHARRVVRKSPRLLGAPRLALRADAGLASAYAAAGEPSRARELVAGAATTLQSLSAKTATTTFECSIPQLWLILTMLELRLGNLDTAATYLDRARTTGWLDLRWLKNDPELRPMHDHPAFLAFAKELSAKPGVEFPMPVFDVGVRRQPNPVSPTL